jgi:1-deoxy-D-xylulose-5-phosphate synthase
VLEQLADSGALAGRHVLRFGIPDRYVTHGKPDLLHEEIGLTPERIAADVAAALAAPRVLRSA